MNSEEPTEPKPETEKAEKPTESQPETGDTEELTKSQPEGETTEEKNEFDDLNVDDLPPEKEFSAVPGASDMIAQGGVGDVYDWTKAPDRVRAPPRISLDGQTVTIEKADVIIPPKEREWLKSRDGKVDYKYCTFTLHYSADGQQEFYSGVRVFRREEGGVEKYSHPSMLRDRKNQSSKLLGIYADYKKKDINEVTLKEFLAFLNSKPKAVLKVEEVKNPSTNETIKKNMVSTFVEG